MGDQPTQPAELVKNPLKVREDLKDRRAVILDAMAKIRSFFSEKALNLQFDRAKISQKDAFDMITLPLGEIDKAWQIDIQNAKDDIEKASLFEKYVPKVNSTIQFAHGCLEELTATTGGLTPEVIVEMEKKMEELSTNLSGLIMKEDNKDVLSALQWAVGAMEKGDKLSGAKDTIATLEKRIPTEYPKGDSGLMPSLWVIMGFMSGGEKRDLVKNHIAKSDINLKEFLENGNSKGVFTAEEMEELIGGTHTYSEEDKQRFSENWRIQNDHRKQATEMMMSSYGSENPANKMLTLGNVGLTFIQFVAGTTIVGGIITDTFQGGKPKSFEGIVKAIIKPQTLGAGAAMAAISLYRKGLTWKETLASKTSRDTVKEKQAYKNLKMVMHGDTASWKRWHEFFKTDDGNGIKAFFAHLQEVKKLNDGKIDENLAKVLNGPKFSEHLAEMAKNPNADKKIDYAALKRSFDKIKNTDNMITLGQVFDQLNIRGAITVAAYEDEIKKANDSRNV